jgi:hypothetical protein
MVGFAYRVWIQAATMSLVDCSMTFLHATLATTRSSSFCSCRSAEGTYRRRSRGKAVVAFSGLRKL